MANVKAMNFTGHPELGAQAERSSTFLNNDIWSQKARERMNTARGKRTIAVINSMSPETAIVLKEMRKEKDSQGKKPTSTFKRIQSIPSNMGSTVSRTPKSKSPPRSRTPEDRKSSVRLSQVYDKHRPQKLDGDITDPQTWDTKQSKFVLGGGKLDNAMEIVEIVNADDPKPPPLNEDLEEAKAVELARINSINKCNVWFEAHEEFMEPSESDLDRGNEGDT